MTVNNCIVFRLISWLMIPALKCPFLARGFMYLKYAFFNISFYRSADNTYKGSKLCCEFTWKTIISL